MTQNIIVTQDQDFKPLFLKYLLGSPLSWTDTAVYSCYFNAFEPQTTKAVAEQLGLSRDTISASIERLKAQAVSMIDNGFAVVPLKKFTVAKGGDFIAYLKVPLPVRTKGTFGTKSKRGLRLTFAHCLIYAHLHHWQGLRSVRYFVKLFGMNARTVMRIISDLEALKLAEFDRVTNGFRATTVPPETRPDLFRGQAPAIATIETSQPQLQGQEAEVYAYCLTRLSIPHRDALKVAKAARAMTWQQFKATADSCNGMNGFDSGRFKHCGYLLISKLKALKATAPAAALKSKTETAPEHTSLSLVTMQKMKPDSAEWNLARRKIGARYNQPFEKVEAAMRAIANFIPAKQGATIRDIIEGALPWGRVERRIGEWKAWELEQKRYREAEAEEKARAEKCNTLVPKSATPWL